MVQPEAQFILDEIAASKRRVAGIESSMHEIAVATNIVIMESRDLIDRVTRQLEKREEALPGDNSLGTAVVNVDKNRGVCWRSA